MWEYENSQGPLRFEGIEASNDQKNGHSLDKMWPDDDKCLDTFWAKFQLVCSCGWNILDIMGV